jgi:hypothetical protein
LLGLIPEYGSGDRRKRPARGEIRPLGCREIAGSNLARSNEPLSGLPYQTGGMNWRGDHIHLYLFTAVYMPVQTDVVMAVRKCLSRSEKRLNLYFAALRTGRWNGAANQF